jgi:hypothetical protein
MMKQRRREYIAWFMPMDIVSKVCSFRIDILTDEDGSSGAKTLKPSVLYL